MKTEDEAQRGFEAQKLLNNPILVEAFDSIRQSIVNKWRSAPIRDKEGMHELKLMDKLLTELEGYLKIVLETGKMADIQLEQERRLRKLDKAGIR